MILSLLLLGSLLVLALPELLPPLESSAFIRPESLAPQPQPDLIATCLPFNIFTALAADSFPAVVLFAAVLDVLLQGLPEKEVLLVPLEQLRLAPLGVLALTASSAGSMTPEQLLRSQGLLVVSLVALVILALLILVLLQALTPLSLEACWRLLHGPLALTASSGNLMIALPLLNSSLR